MSRDAGAARNDRDGPLPSLLLLLTVGTGLLDAVSYLKLGHVFVANMTGNIVFLGFGAAGVTDVSVAASLLALAAFLAGGAAGGRIGVRYGQHRGRLLVAATAVETVFVAITLLVALTGGAGSNPGVGTKSTMIVLLAAGLGIQNAMARRIAVPDLTTTVLTLTLTGLIADSRWGGGTSPRWSRRLLSVAMMLVGALAGGFLVLHVTVAAALGAATALLLMSGVTCHRLASPAAAWAKPS